MTRALPVLAALALALPASVIARMTEEPKSFALQDASLQEVDRKVLKRIDPARLLAEDKERGKRARRPGPLRIAVTEDVAFNPDNSGTWRSLPDGRLWRLVIHSPGAVGLSLGITEFQLPEGAKLWIYAPARKQVEGPYTARDRSRHGRLFTPVILGDEIVVELFVPAGAARTVLQIGKVNKGFRAFGKGGPGEKQGSCNNDVICPEGDPWRDQIRSVALYTIVQPDGTYVCSGQLVNNTAWNRTPYFLSANHCGVGTTNDDTLVFYWNFESAACGDLSGGSLADNQTGAIFRASSAASDFLLVELEEDPDPSFNVFFSGWDATGAASASTVGIHHPSGDEKSISFNTNAVTSTAYLSNTVSAAANHWRVDDWEDGTTEGGSSGSCLWDATSKRCVGQLHGGFASCGAPNDSDWYGKLSVSWVGGGSAATRLSDWLDPVPTGEVAIDGDPHITTLDGTHYDFQGAGEFVALRDPAVGAEIQVRQAPIATTFNPGADAHHGLATCVSLNTAVAARVGGRRVTYEPNLSGVPDPTGLQLRVDGVLTPLTPAGIDLGAGGRVAQTSAPGGIQITIPDRYTLFVTPGWWSSQSKWYLNVGVLRTPAPRAVSGDSPSGGPRVVGGLGGTIPRGSWLPTLPDGSSMGPMPAALHDRYVALYQKFGEAWRVTDDTSLFDYAPGTSTATFTLGSWPTEVPPCVLPQVTPVKPLSLSAARQACQRVLDRKTRASCVFDVRVTGERGFAQTYLRGQKVRNGATTLSLRDDQDPTKPGEPVTFTATAARRASGVKGVPRGSVQFSVDGEPAGEPVPLDARGRAVFRTTTLASGTRRVAATYIPGAGSGFLSSSSPEELHVVWER